MEWNKQRIAELLAVVCGGVAFYCALQNLGTAAAALRWLLGILSPFLLGGALAFVLNVPMRAIERHLYPYSRRGAKFRRPLALVLTLAGCPGGLDTSQQCDRPRHCGCGDDHCSPDSLGP